MDILKLVESLNVSNDTESLHSIYADNIRASGKQTSISVSAALGHPRDYAAQHFIPWNRLDIAGEKTAYAGRYGFNIEIVVKPWQISNLGK